MYGAICHHAVRALASPACTKTLTSLLASASPGTQYLRLESLRKSGLTPKPHQPEAPRRSSVHRTKPQAAQDQGDGLRPQPREKLPRLWLSAWHTQAAEEAS